MIKTLMTAVFGTRFERERKRIQPVLDAIHREEERLKDLGEDELKAQTTRFRERLAERTGALKAELDSVREAKHGCADPVERDRLEQRFHELENRYKKELEASLDDTIVMSRLAEAYARFGSREEANATLKRVLELEPNDGLAVYNCSCAYALLGEKESSLILLRRAYENGFKTVGHWARMDSAFHSLHSDPEFQQLLTELQ